MHSPNRQRHTFTCLALPLRKRITHYGDADENSALSSLVLCYHLQALPLLLLILLLVLQFFISGFSWHRWDVD